MTTRRDRAARWAKRKAVVGSGKRARSRGGEYVVAQDAVALDERERRAAQQAALARAFAAHVPSEES